MFLFRKITLLVIVGISFSCTKKAKVEVSKTHIRVYPQSVKLHKAVIVPWSVGLPDKDQTVSKGVRVSLQFPKIGLKEMDAIISRFEVDSWIVQVKRATYSSSELVGKMYIPISIPGRFADSKYRRLPMKNGVISIYFSAANISKKYERLPCPMQGHNRLVTSVDIDRFHSQDSLYVGASEAQRVGGKIIDFGYDATVLDGGKSILGDYTFEFAFYNSKEKQRVSNFVKSPDILKIKDEDVIDIRGCEDYSPPVFKDEGNKWDQFRWKRK